ncbi:MAG: tryptophan 7-halogenase [Verrucomicrobiota bacterium]|nr:tryptophan 7-halogenase [Verrucomicrobiota bacterium]
MKIATKFDFLVLGSGFGGTITSMVLRQQGYSVALVEKGTHPRFAIGESSTPFSNLLLEKLAVNFGLPILNSFSEWGRWQREMPQISAGLKRGFSFFHHEPGITSVRERSKQLLVAASPNDVVADTHWYRPEFDEFLVKTAQENGVIYFDSSIIQSCRHIKGSWTVSIARYGAVLNLSAGFIIDASGSNSFLANMFHIPNRRFEFMPQTCAVYAHFQNVHRFDQSSGFNSNLPYPPDDAALHHVFRGGWIWVLRFNNGITSAGAALEDWLATELNDSSEDAENTWKRLLQRFPAIQAQFKQAEAVTPFYFTNQLSFRRSEVAGESWAMLPSAAGFVDPLLSTGFPLTLLGIYRLGKVFQEKGPHLRKGDLTEYQAKTFAEMDTAADLISALYFTMGSPEKFNLLALVYFAAMSFTETAWRLKKEELASSFLLAGDLNFSAGLKHLCNRARSGSAITPNDISSVIENYDIAGLGDWSRNNYYDVRLSDLFEARHKLGATTNDLIILFEKLGLESHLLRA